MITKGSLSDMEDEVWKPFRDTRYDISNKGRVRSTSRPDASGHIRKKNVGVMIQKKTVRGYFQIGVNGKWTMVHRMVAEVFVPNKYHSDISLSELVVHHKDNNKLNNESTNLQWVTQSENTRKAYTDGLVPEKSEEAKRAQGDRFLRINEEHKKKIFITNKEEGKTYTFNSAADGSLYFGYAKGYFSELITKRAGENPTWKAEYVL